MLTPQTALRVRMPLASPNAQYPDLPEPLAPVLAEHRIDGATAIAYSVKAGQYIQLAQCGGQPVRRLSGLRRERTSGRNWTA